MRLRPPAFVASSLLAAYRGVQRFGAAFIALVLLALPGHTPAAARFESAQDSVERVLRLADERMSLMPSVAAVKWQSKAPIADLPRERAVIARAGELAGDMGLAPEGVRAVFEAQVRAARESQLRLHEQWRAHGFQLDGPIPSLDDDLRPRLDRVTTELLRALDLATAELGRADFIATYAPLTAKTLRASGWLESDRQQLLAKLAQVRRLPLGSPSMLERITASGVLRIGTTGDYAPFTLEQNNALSGADIDLAQLLAARLHAQPVFVRTSWSGLLDDLTANRFDVAMSGISVTTARAAVGAFSMPYSSGGKTVIARCNDAKRFSTLGSIDKPNVRVIVNPGGTNERYVRDSLHEAKILMFPDNRTIFGELEARRADVMITDDVEVELQTRRRPALCRAMPGTLTHADKAILMPQDEALVSATNAWLAAEIAAGTPAKLLDEHLR